MPKVIKLSFGRMEYELEQSGSRIRTVDYAVLVVEGILESGKSGRRKRKDIVMKVSIISISEFQ